MKQSDKIAIYEGYLKLDGVDTDEALIQQPQCFYEVSKILADLKLEKRNEEVALKRLEGRVAKAKRKKYESRDNYATDTCITQLVDSDDKVKDLRRKYNYICMKVEKLDGLKEAYRQRSFSLNALAGRKSEHEFMSDSVLKKSKGKKRNRISRSL